jgi:hypothetical protein
MNKIAARGLLLLLIGVSAYYIALHYAVLGLPTPTTQDEPGFIEITAAGNPYVRENLVECGSVYGPMYAWWARPFTRFISNPYIAHRWANTLALFATLAVLGGVLHRYKMRGIAAASGVAVVYMLCVSSHSLAASSDLLAMAFYVIAIAASSRGSWPSLTLGIVCSILGVLTKPYALLAWGIVASHLFLFAPKSRALIFFALSALVGGLSVALINLLAPDYFGSTFSAHSSMAARDFNHLLAQTAEFALLTVAFVILALLQRPQRRTFSIAWDKPFFSPDIDLWDWAALVAAVVLLGFLGWHPGNYLVYYYHLLLVPLVISALRRFEEWPRAGGGLLIANVCVLGYFLPPLPGNTNWAVLEGNVAEVHGKILADPLLEPLTHQRQNLELIERGQTATIQYALDLAGRHYDAPGSVGQLLRDRAQVQHARIAAEEFDAIYLCFHVKDGQSLWTYNRRHDLQQALFAHYSPKEEILVYPYYFSFKERLRHGTVAVHVLKWVPHRLAPPSALEQEAMKRFELRASSPAATGP